MGVLDSEYRAQFIFTFTFSQDIEEQHSGFVQGHDAYQHVWARARPAICLLYVPVLRPYSGSAAAGTHQSL